MKQRLTFTCETTREGTETERDRERERASERGIEREVFCFHGVNGVLNF